MLLTYDLTKRWGLWTLAEVVYNPVHVNRVSQHSPSSLPRFRIVSFSVALIGILLREVHVLLWRSTGDSDFLTFFAKMTVQISLNLSRSYSLDSEILKSQKIDNYESSSF
jgi:hypothetical protein